MTSYEFEVAAKNVIIEHALDKREEKFNIYDIGVVYFTRILNFMKGIFIDNAQNKRMYEVTYDYKEDALYLDEYEKTFNEVVHIPNYNV